MQKHGWNEINAKAGREMEKQIESEELNKMFFTHRKFS